MLFTDNFSLAFRSVRSNKLRTGITVAIIAFGIMALIGIITAIKAMNQKFAESFSTLGANAFTVRFKERVIRIGNSQGLKLSRKGDKKENNADLGKMITRDEAEAFVKQFSFPSVKSISLYGNRNNTAAWRNRKTNPSVFIFGGDENYLLLNGYRILYGRNISQDEVQSGARVCVIGSDVAQKLFRDEQQAAVNTIIRLNNIPYRVTGVLESRGSSFGFSRDNIIIAGYRNAEQDFPSGFSYVVAIMTDNLQKVKPAMGEAEGTFRAVRKLGAREENNFVIDRSDSLAEKAMNILRYFTLAIICIGFITLIGSAIALMNIMLVSVSERTREVGLVKALGGTGTAVRSQFLIESVIISLLGALLGIVLGVFFGNIASALFKTGFIVPWDWVILGIVICSIVGLLAGLYPAIKAGRLNPIEALRYE